jgi:hypothetical protein
LNNRQANLTNKYPLRALIIVPGKLIVSPLPAPISNKIIEHPKRLSQLKRRPPSKIILRIKNPVIKIFDIPKIIKSLNPINANKVVKSHQKIKTNKVVELKTNKIVKLPINANGVLKSHQKINTYKAVKSYQKLKTNKVINKELTQLNINILIKSHKKLKTNKINKSPKVFNLTHGRGKKLLNIKFRNLDTSRISNNNHNAYSNMFNILNNTIHYFE